jgi:hypothetical protein
MFNMIIIDAQLLMALAAMLTSLAALIRVCRYRPGADRDRE